MKPTFITATDIAALLELDNADSFLRARHRLEDEDGFPTPMPLPLRPLKWRREAVQAWIDAQGMPACQMPDPDELRSRGVAVLMAEASRV